MNPELQLAAELADQYIKGIGTTDVSIESDPEKLRARLARELTDDGSPSLEVLRSLYQDALPGLLNTADGRFFGWVIGGTLPVAIAADWLVSAWDQNAAAYACAPSMAVIEDITADWLKDILGLPDQASYAFVTGCQMASFTALAAARHKVLKAAGWAVEEQGLFGAPPIRIIVGEYHETLMRAIRQLGVGANAVRQVALEDDGTISIEALAAELESDPEAPTIVSLAAGDLNRGAFDPIGQVCDIAQEYGAWVHIDGAFGLWAGASGRFRHLVKGVDKADSWATDAHKWLNVPYASGLVFVKDAEAHKSAMTIPAAYKVEVEDVRDQIDWGPEWSRRARAVPVYAALRVLGRNGVASIVENCCDAAAAIVNGLARLPGVEVLAWPVINQGLVRFLADDGDHDRRTDEIIARINATGKAWFGPTQWHGMRVMRISVSNYRTSEDDVDQTIEIVKQALVEP